MPLLRSVPSQQGLMFAAVQLSSDWLCPLGPCKHQRSQTSGEWTDRKAARKGKERWSAGVFWQELGQCGRQRGLAGSLFALRVSKLQKITLIPQTDALLSAFFSLVCSESTNSAVSEEQRRTGVQVLRGQTVRVGAHGGNTSSLC